MLMPGRRCYAEQTPHVGGGGERPTSQETDMKRQFHTQGGCGGMVSMILLGVLVVALMLLL